MPNWYEVAIGSDAQQADNNSDPDNNGWTLLEEYLEFMANPYIVLKSGGKGSINLTDHFKGFAKSPVFTCQVLEGENVASVSVGGSTLYATAQGVSGIAVVKVVVTDADGTTYERRMSVAVTDDVTAISSPSVDFSNVEVAKREFYTLDGKKVESMRSHETYVMRITDTKGNIHSVKIIKD